MFLKRLPSGLLLISGPMAVNGVPLRRVNQAYVIATSTKVDISGVKIDDSKINDALFKRKEAEGKAEGKDFFAATDAAKGEAKKVDPARAEAQKSVDSQLLAAVKKVANLKEYLSAPFGLKKGQYPHAMKF